MDEKYGKGNYETRTTGGEYKQIKKWGIEDLNNQEKIEYSLIECKFRKTTYYCFWYDSGTEDLFLTEKGCLKYFNYKDEAITFCGRNNMPLFLSNDDDNKFDFDTIEEWDENTSINCHIFLNIWNIISDISHSIKESFLGDSDDALDVYNKIFYGCNLPAIRKNTDIYIPNWTPDEINSFSLILNNMLKILDICFKKNIEDNTKL